jgi:hypothetical protein
LRILGGPICKIPEFYYYVCDYFFAIYDKIKFSVSNKQR